MSSPMPVPSKAAIRALRGLVFGTTCTIAILTEDRRRRIRTASTALGNAKRIKSSRQYHASGAAEALQPRDDIRPDDDFFSYAYLPARKRDLRDPEWISSAPSKPTNVSVVPSTTDGSEQVNALQSVPTLPTSAIRKGNALTKINPLPEPLSKQNLAKSTGSSWFVHQRSSYIDLSNDLLGDESTLLPRLKELIAHESEEALGKALSMFSLASQRERISKSFGSSSVSVRENGETIILSNYPWLQVTADLCIRCQHAGRIHDARKILEVVVDSTSLDEDLFFAHEPIPVLDSLLSPAEGHKLPTAHSFDSARKIFLARFQEKPKMHSREVLRLGEELIRIAFVMGRGSLSNDVYWRILGRYDEPSSFISWFMSLLHLNHDHKAVIKHFLLNYSKYLPEKESFTRTIENVVKSVEATAGLKASLVLKALVRMANEHDLMFRSTWIAQLLHAYHKRYKDFTRTKGLFDELLAAGLLNKTYNPHVLLRVMTDLAVRAEDLEAAGPYFREAVRVNPPSKTDIRFLGHFALAKAKETDWEGVRNDFKTMLRYRRAQPDAYQNVFVPILKEYAVNHTARETGDFLKTYLQDLDMQLNHHMVSLILKRFGEARDIDGFLEWIELSGSTGVALDSGFCNGILHSCRTQWKFGFQDLRKLFRKIRQLSPSSPDEVTQRIMHNAAVAAGRQDGFHVSRRIRSLKFEASPLSRSGRSANKRDVYEAMKQDFVSRNYIATIRTYRRAVNFGMPFSKECFRLAVEASLKHNNGSCGHAMLLVHNAHAQGHDVSSAIFPIIQVQMQISSNSGVDGLRHVRDVIGKFENGQIQIPANVFSFAATKYLEQGHLSQAIALCKEAAERSESGSPCCSRINLRVLLMAHTQLLAIKPLESLLHTLLESPFATDKKTMSLLKTARRTASQMPNSPEAEQVVILLNKTLDIIQGRRAELFKEGETLAQAALDILAEAVNLNHAEGFSSCKPKPLDIREGQENSPAWKKQHIVAANA